MPEADASFKIQDAHRASYILECRKAVYGFVDVPLMFQLSLMSFMVQEGFKALLMRIMCFC